MPTSTNPFSLAVALLKKADLRSEGWVLLRRTLLLCLAEPAIKFTRDVVDLAVTTETSRRDVRSFRRSMGRLIWWVCGAIIWRSVIEHHQKQLEVLWRGAITRCLHEKYIRGKHFYDALYHAKKELRISDADTRICEDVPLVAAELAKMSAQLPASILDCLVGVGLCLSQGSWRLIVSSVAIIAVGVVGPNIVAPVSPSEVMKPTQAALSALQQRLMRIQANDEQICALQGGQVERKLVDEAVTGAVQASHTSNKTMLQNQTAQYLMLGIGLPGYTKPGRSATVATSLFFCFPFYANMMVRIRSKDHAQAGFIPPSTQVPGMAERFTEGLFYLNYSATLTFGLFGLAQNLISLSMIGGQLLRVKELFDCLESLEEAARQGDASSAVKDSSDEISFEGVNIVTPTGVTLVRELSFKVGLGDSLLITGHNGAGKSSVFRVLGGLWEHSAGIVGRPSFGSGTNGGVCYCPQKPYAVLGTLSDFFYYPHHPPLKDCRAEVRHWLSFVELEHIADRPDAFDTEHDWEEELSLGELQRINMVKLFYLRPHFVILDECTSAVSLDMERRLFDLCRCLGISHVTIAHRPMLEQLHNRMLTLSGKPLEADGGWKETELPEPPQAASEASKDSEPAMVIETYLKQHGLCSKTADVLPTKSAMELDRPKPRSLAGQGGALAQLGRIAKALALGMNGAPAAKPRLALILALCIARTGINTYNFTTCISSCIVAALTNDKIAFIKRLVLGMLSGGALSVLDAACVQQAQALELATWQTMVSRFNTRLFNNDALYALRLRRPMTVQDPARRVLDARAFVENCFLHLFDTLQPMLMFAVGATIVIRKVGVVGISALLGAFGVGRIAAKVLMPNFAEQVLRQVELNNKFKIVHSRLQQHAEAVAFSNGAKVERVVVEGRFNSLLDHLRLMLREEFLYSTTKLAFTSGSGLPLFALKTLGMRFASLQFGLAMDNGATSAANLGINLDFDRVVQQITVPPISVLADIPENLQRLDAEACNLLELDELLTEIANADSEGSNQPSEAATSEEIELRGMSLAVPSGKILAKQLNVVVTPQHSLVATGPNASGKSSLSRLLLGLWPAKEGQVWVCGKEVGPSMPRPPVRNIYVATEKPYLCHGRPLAAQLCYPLDGDLTAAELKQLFEAVGLLYLLDRYDAWKEVWPWQDVLSGGEQQRLCIARLLYHRPKFAVLDDCTSMISQEAEALLYKVLTGKEITLIGMSQRLLLPDIFKSELALGIDDAGGWRLRT